MQLRARSLAAIVMIAGLVGACAPETEPSTSTTPEVAAPTAAAQPATYPVHVDGKPQGYNGAFLAYFPSEVKVHAGDTVQFNLVDTGEPHTVTFGKLADAAVAEFKKLGPIEGEGSPAAMALPPAQASPTSLDLLQSAVQPCYMDSGPVPTTACPQVDQPAFNGQQEVYNSGWLAPEATWSVKLADDLAPGTYSYICLIHRGVMTGSVTVAAKDETVPSADEVKQAGESELQALSAKMKPSVDQAVAGATAEQAVAGVLSPDVMNALGSVFAPQVITVPVGSSITWTSLGPHTISFNSPEDANQTRTENSDGSVVINPKVIQPVGGAGMPAPEAAGAPPPAASGPTPDPNAPPPPPTLIDGGSWDGQGEHSSGLLVSFPPTLFAYKLTFTKAGTYPFRCLIHPDMEGTVNVQ